ncbi:YrrS family protein [Oceanobacillus sp. Castelsardo]|uniref:YrrS family protein n=1 Tax=Oceanobacillus sp. Castelsardo TaxID=1851204 RepID=UPI000838DD19|nr:YrrS family protein [Oceanobacillus sp. Castelsardo]
MAAKENGSRINKYEKRRKNTKLISFFIVIGIILFISLISIWLFGDGDSTLVEETEQAQNDTSNETGTTTNSEQEDQSIVKDDNGGEEKENEEQEITTEEVDPSDDNVVKAYEGNWEAVGTEQEGQHTVNYSEGSQDRKEMTVAIQTATGLVEGNYREWWVANGGDQKVIATVSDSNQSEVYRVYLAWNDGEGWQPTKVELLKENDWKKYQ